MLDLFGYITLHLHFTDPLVRPMVLDVKHVVYQFVIDKQLCHSNIHNTLIKI